MWEGRKGGRKGGKECNQVVTVPGTQVTAREGTEGRHRMDVCRSHAIARLARLGRQKA